MLPRPSDVPVFSALLMLDTILWLLVYFLLRVAAQCHLHVLVGVICAVGLAEHLALLCAVLHATPLAVAIRVLQLAGQLLAAVYGEDVGM